MKLFRLFTENKNIGRIRNELSIAGIDSYSIIHCDGLWNGDREKGLCIEIAVLNHEAAEAHLTLITMCRVLCSYNNQDSIFLQILDMKGQIIGKSGLIVED